MSDPSDLFEAFLADPNTVKRTNMYVRIPPAFKDLFRFIAKKEGRDITETVLMAAFLLRKQYESRGGKISEDITKGMDEYAPLMIRKMKKK